LNTKTSKPNLKIYIPKEYIFTFPQSFSVVNVCNVPWFPINVLGIFPVSKYPFYGKDCIKYFSRNVISVPRLKYENPQRYSLLTIYRLNSSM
jgi:hypothetical protein